MNHEEMSKWVFTQILEGLCQGTPLRRIAGNIAFGLGAIVNTNLEAAKAESKKAKKP